MSDARNPNPTLHRMRSYEHRILSLEQVTYNATTDRAVAMVDGFDALSSEGWELVTTCPSYGYAPRATTLFIFRRERRS
jgi:hypothetical protein